VICYFCHPVGQELKKDNEANIMYNKGIMSAQNSTAVKCPDGHSKSFCDGFDRTV
jgi:hypothetical protein